MKHFKLGTVGTDRESGNRQFTEKFDKKVDRSALDHVGEGQQSLEIKMWRWGGVHIKVML
jgi:hypothetical protein